MADVELVIKIPKQAYDLLQNEGVDWLGAEHILDAVSKGTPLPEHHGDLIDRNNLIKDRVENDNVVILAKNAPTIIEADRAEGEE